MRDDREQKQKDNLQAFIAQAILMFSLYKYISWIPRQINLNLQSLYRKCDVYK